MMPCRPIKTPFLCALLVCLVTLTASRFTRAQATAGQQLPAQLNKTVEVRLGYLFYLPEKYAEQDKWPLLLFLHGAGERGQDLELVKRHGPPKQIAAGQHLPLIVASPQCPTGRSWEPIELVALLDELAAKYKVDPDRVYVSGLSMGGYGTWRLAGFAPTRLAAIIPICGAGEASWTRNYGSLPVWAFHGAQDTSVPVQRSEVMVESLKKLGNDAKLTIYPEAGHDSWTATYDDPAVWEWMLAQKRSVKP